jgi:DNA-binding LytR/AlgR family response regulator
MKYRCLVVDDNPIIRQGIESFITKDNRTELMEGTDVLENALKLLSNGDVDIIFLDDHLPSSFSMYSIDYMKRNARKDEEIFKNKVIIFVTASEQGKVYDFLELHRDYPDLFVDYISKQKIDETVVIKSLSLALDTLNRVYNKTGLSKTKKVELTAKGDRKIFSVDMNNIIFVKSESIEEYKSRITRYVVFYYNYDNIVSDTVITENLEYFEKEKDFFIRISKSHIISKNKKYFHAISTNKSEIYLVGKLEDGQRKIESITVGNTVEYKDNLEQYLRL